MTLDAAAETVRWFFGFDSTIYGNFNKKNKERGKWLWYVELKEQRVRDIQTEML
jgi:hypothetical protein